MGTPSGTAVPPAISTDVRDVKRVSEVESLTDEYSQTFTTDRDQYVTEVSLDPQRYRSESGKWLPIDNNIVESEDGRGLLRNAGGIFDVRFHTAAQGVEITVEGKTLQFSFQTSNDLKPVVDREDSTKVWYRDVWPGVDASYTVSNVGVKEEFVVRDRDAWKDADGFPMTWKIDGAVVEDREMGFGYRVDWDRDGKILNRTGFGGGI